MGLFDFWMSEDQKIAKHQRTLTDKNVQAEDRDAAARWLAQNPNPKAIVALLTRFDMALENGLKDKGEKEAVAGLVLSLGEAAVRPLERHLEKCRHIAIPLKLFIDLRGEEAGVQRVFEVLEIERRKDDFKAEKKNDLLVWLAHRKHPGAIEAAAPHLQDFDEGVRYAAAEVIAAQAEDRGREPLLAALVRPEEDSNRLRSRLADIFAKRGWPVPDGTALPAGFTLRDGRVAAA